MITIFLTLVAVHLVTTDALFLVIQKALRGVERPSSRRIFMMTRGLGPAALAVVTYTSVVLLPGRSSAFYLTIVALVFLAPAALAISELRTLRECYSTSWRWLSRHLRRRNPLVVATAAMLLLGVLLGVGLPLVEHDGVAAAMEARIALRDNSFSNYLAIEEPDPETGFYMETFRPPFLQSLYLFYGWLGGTENLDFLIRTTSPIFGIQCLLLLGAAVRRHHSEHAARWSVFLLAVTPIFFYMTYNNGIDTARLYLAVSALLWMTEVAATGSLRVAVVAGGTSGLALFCHLLSVPVLLGGGLAMSAFGAARLPRRLVTATTLAAVALLAGASFHYLMAPPVAAKIAQSLDSGGQSWLTKALRMTSRELRTGAKRKEPPAPTRPPAREGRPVSSARRPDIPSPPEPRPGTAVENPRPEPRRAPPAHPAGAGDRVLTSRKTAPTTADRTPLGAETEPRKTAPGNRARGAARADDGPERAVDRHAELLEMRGQGRTAFHQLVFGRLQMFTGIEHFGWIFYLFWSGVALFLLRGAPNTLERILASSAVVTTIVVLSGVRQLSWSNPRYVATLLPVAAYFAGPFVENAGRLFGGRRWRKLAFAACLVFPVILVTSIRGAKVEITNPGSFYGDFRSLRWVRYSLEDPADALKVFWNDYLGIRKTVRYFFADRDEQLRQAHDYFAAVLWIRDNLPEDCHVMVFRDARFFYYSERHGTVWYSPVIHQREYLLLPSPEALLRYLRWLGIEYVLVDDYSTRLPGYVDHWTGQVLDDGELAQEIFAFGTARVYRLLEAPTDVEVPDP